MRASRAFCLIENERKSRQIISGRLNIKKKKGKKEKEKGKKSNPITQSNRKALKPPLPALTTQWIKWVDMSLDH
jgi:hypothetical protein